MTHWVHRTLLFGVVVSGTLLATGLLLVLVEGQARPEGPPPAIGSMFERLFQGDGSAWLHLGIVALTATPVLRVAALAAGWGLARQWRFSAAAAVVLGLLLVSFLIGVG